MPKTLRPESFELDVTLFLLLLFWPFTAFVLWLDGQNIAHQNASNLLAPLFLLALMSQMRPSQQLIVALFVPLSALGEALFSLVFGLYSYRLETVPLYVPFGHSILLGIGLLWAQTRWIESREKLVTIALLLLHGSLIAGAFLLFGDSFSVLSGLIFLVVWMRTGCKPLFLLVGVLVLYIELLGTYWGCWVWHPAPWGLLKTINPPVGAFAFYIIGDWVAFQVALLLTPRLLRWREQKMGAN